jgi:hypothetical protein
MEADINVIVDVDPEEATLLISLIETLLTDWYIARHNHPRREFLCRLVVGQSDHREQNCAQIARSFSRAHRLRFTAVRRSGESKSRAQSMGTCTWGSWRTRRFQRAREEIQRISLDERTSPLARAHRGNCGTRYHCDLHGKMKIIRASPRPNYLSILLATNFSSLTMSAANFRIPSAVFSVAMALSFTR